jgi:multidrug transporter EmrE-like cation transporter
MKFQLDHISTLFKYTGISFVAGAITHGFFSEERSFWTAVIGLVLYLVGGVIAKLSNPNQDQTWTSVILIGIFASIGLGFFTGGLQHFPDSPARSVWVVPVGFLMSLVAVYLMEGKKLASIKSAVLYAVIGGAIITAASLYAYEYYEHHGSPHGDNHSHGAPSQPAPADQGHSHGPGSKNHKH